MILQVCYNNDCTLFPAIIRGFCEEHFPNVSVESYNEHHYMEKKKAYKIKGGYSARMTPFMLLLTDDKQYVKAFYSEDDSCTLDNFEKFLNNIEK